ncbi:hypothetical protein D3C81_1191760 [compost metagenome]
MLFILEGNTVLNNMVDRNTFTAELEAVTVTVSGGGAIRCLTILIGNAVLYCYDANRSGIRFSI